MKIMEHLPDGLMITKLLNQNAYQTKVQVNFKNKEIEKCAANDKGSEEWGVRCLWRMASHLGESDSKVSKVAGKTLQKDRLAVPEPKWLIAFPLG